ncbi:MAG: c-type cytochrome, partial [Burkholderiales bacterium]|nr:c-type cytochrome [Burkholderiales bacterium]
MKHRPIPIACGLVLAALLVTSAQAQELPNAKAVYDATCAPCHATGAAGAPRTGDTAAWSARFDKGISELYASAIKGKGAMPPKGGNSSLTDAQVMAAVNYITGLSASPGAAPSKEPSKERKSAKPAETAKGGTAPKAAKGGAVVVADTAKGKLVYQATCAACHSSGLAGSPKLGDVAAWAPRTKAGTDALYANAIKGKGAMPPKGGNASLPDADLRAAVDFMLAQLHGDAAPPKPSVPVAPAAQAPAAKPAAVASVPVASVPTAAVPERVFQVQESGDPNSFNRLLTAPAQRNRPPLEDGIHDPTSPGTALLQPPLRSFQTLPRSNIGNYVDWVAALASKRIQPRWDIGDPGAQATVMDLNIVREVKGSKNDVVFPHKQHTEWLDCSNCHPAIFKPQKGSNQISMA